MRVLRRFGFGLALACSRLARSVPPRGTRQLVAAPPPPPPPCRRAAVDCRRARRAVFSAGRGPQWRAQCHQQRERRQSLEAAHRWLERRYLPRWVAASSGPRCCSRPPRGALGGVCEIALAASGLVHQSRAAQESATRLAGRLSQTSIDLLSILRPHATSEQSAGHRVADSRLVCRSDSRFDSISRSPLTCNQSNHPPDAL